MRAQNALQLLLVAAFSLGGAACEGYVESSGGANTIGASSTADSALQRAPKSSDGAATASRTDPNNDAASLPLWAGVVGDTVGGLATDWLLAKTGNIKFARRVVAITGMLGCAVFIVPAALATEAYTAVYCLTAAMFFLECTIGPSWAVPMDMGGEVSGTVSGMMNMAGNIGGALSPIVFGVLVQFGSWEAPFIVAASLLVIGAAIWGFWLDPSVSVVEKKAAELPPGSAAASARTR